MGTSTSESFNEDINIKGDINIYIFGNLNNISGTREDVINYKIIEAIFDKEIPEENGIIRKIKFNNYIYSYKFRKLEKKIHEKNIKKNYNAFIFYEENKQFSDVLIEHLHEKDIQNNNKNVIIYFGENKYIENSIEELSVISDQSIPFLINVKNCQNYDEKLKYINYIPNFFNICRNILNESPNFNIDTILELSKNAILNYILTKLYRIDMYYNELGYNNKLNLINPLNEINSRIKLYLTIGLMGYSGCGKSTLINLVFDELVSRTSTKATDLTTKCSEYYLPVRSSAFNNIGQIRFLDFPGISEGNNYPLVLNQIKKKIEEYKKNMEQIDLVLFYIPNGNGRELTNAGLELIKFLNKQKIKIIFVINGNIKPVLLDKKKNKLKNSLKEYQIIDEDFSNIINTDYYQYYKEVDRSGISSIFEKVIDIIKIRDNEFNVEEISIDNCNEKLEQLRNSSRVFEIYKSINVLKEKSKINATLMAILYSTLACGTSSISIILPFVDTFAAIGYQVAMVYNIFYIYEINVDDYNIVKLIISGGDIIERKDNKNEVSDEKIRNTIGEFTTKGAVFVGQCGIKDIASKEASKVIVEKSINTFLQETVKSASLKVSLFSIKGSAGVTQASMSACRTIVYETSKELIETGIQEGTKQIVVHSSKEALSVGAEGFGIAMSYGSKESIKKVTETIAIQQGGKAWLVNLGKYIPFIGAGISAVINTFSTGKIAYKLINKFDKEFELNQQRQVDIIKGKVYAFFNIIEQLRSIN